MVNLVRRTVVVVVVVVVAPVHESLSVGNLVCHDRRFRTEALVVSRERIPVDMYHWLSRYFKALESVDEVVEVGHHDDLFGPHLEKHVDWIVAPKLGPLPALGQKELCKAVGVESSV